jgi:hypothetical protein
MKTKIASTILLAFSIAPLILLGTAPKLNAKAGCSNATLQGTYAVHATGTVLSGPTTGPIESGLAQ